MLDVVNYILGLGAAIFLPLVMIILGLAMGMKLKKAIAAGLTLGIAFTGMNVILGFMFDAIGPAATALVEHTGLHPLERLGEDFCRSNGHGTDGQSGVWSDCRRYSDRI